MAKAVEETKAQRIERLKREKNAWECLEEIRAFAHHVAAGLDLDTPCEAVANASRPNQELRWTDLAALGSITTLDSPALIIIGLVARSRDEELTSATIHTVGASDVAVHIADSSQFGHETA